MRLALLLALPVAGCLPALPGDDLDGDGWAWTEDCDDLDPAVNPDADDDPCDGVDTNCDGAPEADVDGDGALDPACGGDDCDDSDPDVHPGAEDTPCDGLDQDCSGADAGDEDGDGHYGEACEGDDCDDSDPSVHPGAPEALNSVDDDCDGVTDELPWGDGWQDATGLNAGLHGQLGPTGGLGTSLAPTAMDAVSFDDVGKGPLDPSPDGLGDLLVSAPMGSAAVYLVPGGTAADLAAADVVQRTALRFNMAAAEQFGASLAWLPDIEDDGLPEVVIGAPAPDNGTNPGHVYLFRSGGWAEAREGTWGERELNAADASLIIEGAEPGDGFGRATVLFDPESAKGPMLAVGAPLANVDGEYNKKYLGEVDLFDQMALRGSDTITPELAFVAITGTSEHEFVGTAGAVMLDLDGSGVQDVVVAAPGSALDDGMVGVLRGEDIAEASLTLDDLDHLVKGEDTRRIGQALAAGGDMDADGYPDLALVSTNSTFTAHEVEVLSGDLWSQRSAASSAEVRLFDVEWETTAVLAEDPRIALNGSFNGDEYADLVIGAPGVPLESGDGPVLIYYGGPSLPPTQDTAQADARIRGPEGSEFGYTAVAALELGPDGLPFLVVGAPMDGEVSGDGLPQGAVYFLDPWKCW
ncbi:MAG: MopE-related protein [Pseudomonadota bacterium]